MNERRRIKTFTEVSIKVLKNQQNPDGWETICDKSIDDQVNEWVESEGHVVLQVNPMWRQVEEHTPEGWLVRRSILKYVVVYVTGQEYRQRLAGGLGVEQPAGPGRPVPPYQAGGPAGAEAIHQALMNKKIRLDDPFYRGADS